jgi:hypothetical protein
LTIHEQFAQEISVEDFFREMGMLMPFDRTPIIPLPKKRRKRRNIVVNLIKPLDTWLAKC